MYLAFAALYIWMEIWEEIAQSTEGGCRRLVSEYGKRLYAAALMLCKDENAAEDLFFRTLERSVRKISNYSPGGSFYGWLYAIMLNFRRMDLRKKRELPEPEEFFAESMSDESVFVEKMIENLDAAILRDAVSSLPEVHRKMLLLRYFEDFSITEMVGILEIPEGTVMSRLYNARKSLKKVLEKIYSINEGGKR